MKPRTWVFLEGRVPLVAENTGAGWPNDVQGVALIQEWWCQVNPGTISAGGVPHSAWAGWFLTQMRWVRTYSDTGYTQTVELSMGKATGERQIVEVAYPRDSDFFTGNFSAATEDREMKDWGPLPLVIEDPVPEPPNSGLSMYDVRQEVGQLFQDAVVRAGQGGLRVQSVLGGRSLLAPGRGSLVLPGQTKVQAGRGYLRSHIGRGQTMIRRHSRVQSSAGKISYCKLAYYAERSGTNGGYDWTAEGWMQGWELYDSGGEMILSFPSGPGEVALSVTKVALVVIETTPADYAVSAVNAGTRAVADGLYRAIADRKNVDLLTSGETLTPVWLDSGSIETFSDGVVFVNSLNLLPGDDFATWPFAGVDQTLLYRSDGPFDPSSLEVLTNLSAEWL